MANYFEAVKNIKDDKAAKKKLEEEGELAKLLPEDVQAYSSCKEVGKPGRKFTKKHINTIHFLCCGFRVCGNKGPIFVALDEAFYKAPEKLKAPEVTASEDDKTLTEEPFSEK